MRHLATAFLACSLLIAAAGVRAQSNAYRKIAFDVPPQALSTALTELAAQSNLRIVFDNAQVTGYADRLVGTYTLRDALQKLLDGAGLRFEFVDDRTVEIRAAEVPNALTASNNSMRLANGADASAPESDGRSQARDADTSHPTPSQDAQTDGVREVVVTAQKREERLRDVPVPVGVVSAEELTRSNQVRLDDYYARIPGLSLTTSQPFGPSTLGIRGLIAGLGPSPTVGVTIDDIAYASTTVGGFGPQVVNLDPNDLERIEVLRGPQGTLYGASSIGGLLKYVTKKPSMRGFSGGVQAGISGIHDSNDVGYNFRGTVNAPLGEASAVLASVYYREDPGYIDDPVRGAKDVNHGRAIGGRIAALWKPAENLTLTLSALAQDDKGVGNSHVDILPPFGDLEQSTPPNSEGHHNRLTILSGQVELNFGKAQLTSITAYISNKNIYQWDFSKRFGATAAVTAFGVNGATSEQSVYTDKFTQELRVSLPLTEHIDWLVGGFYNDEKTPHNLQRIYATNYATGVRVGEIAYLPNDNSFKEVAGFTDVTFKFSERFDLQIGGRLSRNEQEVLVSSSGPLVAAFFPPRVHSSDSSSTYLFTPRLKLTDETMLYARLASGYRPGGPNLNAVLAPGVVPAEYGPDRTQNYEVGFKGNFIDDALSIDASVFYIDWRDIQLTLRNAPNTPTFFANAGRATSKGVELATQIRPMPGLSISLSGTYNEAELAEDFPPTIVNAIGSKGDRLPFSSRYAGSVSVDKSFSLTDTLSATVGGSASYVGQRKSVFVATPNRIEFPAYTKLDLYAAVASGGWDVGVFVNNLTDKRGIVSDVFFRMRSRISNLVPLG